MNKVYTSEQILKRVDALDKSEWNNKTVSLIKDVPSKWNPDAPYSVFNPTNDKYLNLLDIYLAIGDPLEYEFAKRVFGSNKQWLKIRDSYWGKKLFPQYREELSLKLKSEAVKGIIDMADDENVKETTKLQALKFIVAGGWGETPKPKIKVMDEKSKIKGQVAADIERIGLKVIK